MYHARHLVHVALEINVISFDLTSDDMSGSFTASEQRLARLHRFSLFLSAASSIDRFHVAPDRMARARKYNR